MGKYKHRRERRGVFVHGGGGAGTCPGTPGCGERGEDIPLQPEPLVTGQPFAFLPRRSPAAPAPRVPASRLQELKWNGRHGFIYRRVHCRGEEKLIGIQPSAFLFPSLN